MSRDIFDSMSFCSHAIVRSQLERALRLASLFWNIALLLTNSIREESYLKVLRLLEANPNLNQRELSVALGVSLGKTNYCLRALLDKGLIKIQNFRNNQNKLSYAYLLTPVGVTAKAELTVRFLSVKMQEYEALKLEIAQLKREADEDQSVK